MQPSKNDPSISIKTPKIVFGGGRIELLAYLSTLSMLMCYPASHIWVKQPTFKLTLIQRNKITNKIAQQVLNTALI